VLILQVTNAGVRRPGYEANVYILQQVLYLSLLLCWDAIDPVKALKDSLPEGLLPSCSLILHWEEPTNLLSILGERVGTKLQV